MNRYRTASVEDTEETATAIEQLITLLAEVVPNEADGSITSTTITPAVES